MLSVKLWGGLGNQMFQYAFGKYLGTIRHDDVFFYKIPYNTELNSELSDFKVDLNFSPVEHLKNNLILPVSELSYRTERKFVQKCPFINPRLQVENSLRYNQVIKQRAVLFDGYWQSYKYVAEVSDIIASEFKPKDEIYRYLLPELAEITTSDSVSVHIRHGDYLSVKNKKIFEHCGIGYYTNAIEKIKNSVQNPFFFIFSDDIEWVKNEKELFNGLNYKIVDNSQSNHSSISDFVLMSLCKHNIIANSTFSWWAAWINQNEKKLIIAPKNWYRGNLNETTEDLIPDSWIRI